MSTTYVSVADSICGYLASVGPLGLTSGVNLFSSLIPDQPDLCVAVFERPGAATLMTLTGGAQLPQSLLDRPSVQIRVRCAADDYATGNTLMQQVWGALQGVANTDLPSGGLDFLLLTAAGYPAMMGQDTRQRYEWSLNLSTILNNSQRILA